MLTWQRIYFEETQEELKNKLLLFKKLLPLVLVQTVGPHGPALPPPLVHKQLLYSPHAHQRLREHTQQHVRNTDTRWWFTQKLELHHLILTPAGHVTPEGFIYVPLLASPAMESSNNPNNSLWISGRRMNLLQHNSDQNASKHRGELTLGISCRLLSGRKKKNQSTWLSVVWFQFLTGLRGNTRTLHHFPSISCWVKSWKANTFKNLSHVIVMFFTFSPSTVNVHETKNLTGKTQKRASLQGWFFNFTLVVFSADKFTSHNGKI